MPRSLARAKGCPTLLASQTASSTPPVPEPVIARTAKLPPSPDNRLRQYRAVSRRTGQEVMHDASRQYLNPINRCGAS